ncbi:MAG: hypothetical protein ACFFDW_13370 [Candidatus Thorarchaeota archaeon]
MSSFEEEKVIIEFVQKFEEYKNYVIRKYYMRPAFLILMPIIVLGDIVLIIGMITGWTPTDFVYITLVVAIAFFALIMSTNGYRIARTNWNRNIYLPKQRRMEISDISIACIRQFCQESWPWNYVRKIEFRKETIDITINEFYVYVIPKEAINNDDYEKLVRIIRRHYSL